jgi:hypothetical protein
MALPICSSFTRHRFAQGWSQSPDHTQSFSIIWIFAHLQHCSKGLGLGVKSSSGGFCNRPVLMLFAIFFKWR